ncbi:MAG: recombinase family protein [Firmicutes bacterium]|nr:recombinase family protein [Bacillota bacterium]
MKNLIFDEYKKYNLLEEIRKEILSGKSIYDLKLRVTFYARVSSDSDEQATSVVNQVDYFTNLIKSVPNWTFINGYIDEGISGKSVNKRDDFLRMIDDGKNDRFDLVLTKSVPRFARNTLDSIKYTQELLKYSVGVYFLNDNINTFLPDSEFRLTLMASIAQDDLRKLSENVKFGLKQSIKRGVVLGSNNIYGYVKNKGTLEIVEKEAVVVKKMFTLYDSYCSLKKTSIALEKLGYFNRKGKPFDTTTIRRILMNPKYKGYYCGNKTTVLDYKSGITKKVSKDKWLIYKDNKKIPPIVTEELWDRVNYELEKKQIGYSNKQRLVVRSNYAYSGKLICKDHNVAYTRSGVKKGRVNDYRYWSCRLYKRGIEYCDSPLLKESELDILFKDIIGKFLKNKDKVKEDLINRVKEHNIDINLTQKISSLNKKLTELQTKKEKLLELVTSSYISNQEFGKKNEEVNTEINNIHVELKDIELKKNSKDHFEEELESLYKQLDKELDIDNNFTSFMDLLIDKVYVSKINNNRNQIKLDISFKTGINKPLNYDNKQPIQNQLMNPKNDYIKFALDELKNIPLNDHYLNTSFTT